MVKIRWHGHACFEITNDVTLVTDPHDGRSIGLHSPNVTSDIILVSHNHYDHNSIKSVEKDGSKIVSDERKRTISNVQINGFESYHDESHGEKRGKNLIFKFILNDITFCHLGDLGHLLDEKTIRQIAEIDILFIPIGGTYTVDSEQAWDVVNAIKPKITIPMHYKIEGLSLPIAGVDPFLEKNKHKILKVGNEIDIEKEELPGEQEVWVFTL